MMHSDGVPEEVPDIDRERIPRLCVLEIRPMAVKIAVPDVDDLKIDRASGFVRSLGSGIQPRQTSCHIVGRNGRQMEHPTSSQILRIRGRPIWWTEVRSLG